MLWPVALFPGKVLLVAETASFNVAYIRRTMECYGVSVLARAGPPDEALAGLSKREVATIVGCLAVDLEPDAFTTIVMDQWPFPFLFVGGYPGPDLPTALAWMHAPFASYQVMDALLKLVLSAPGAPQSR